MKKLIYRALRGNALIEFKDIAKGFKLADGKEELKSVFFVFFQDGESIREKVWNICDLFQGQRIEIPQGNLAGKIAEVRWMIKDTKNVI